jgi:arabinose-5-phosphate isomerase
VRKPARAQKAQTGGEPLVARGKRVLALEAAAVKRLADRLGPSFAQAVELLKAAAGRVIVSGVGKSGLIARKIAATFTSTGTPAWFLHPIDSLHGDLGIVSKRDVAILLSKSGASDELFGLVAQLERFGVPIIALTGNPASPLAQYATVVVGDR